MKKLCLKKTLSSVGFASTMLLSQIATADLLGFRIGIDYWQQDLSGNIESGNNATNVDLEKDLGLNSENNINLYIAFEHPVPFLPNLLLQRTTFKTDNKATLSRSIVFDGNTYNLSEDIQSKLELSFFDITAYYEVLDTDLSVDLGLTLRILDAAAEINSSSESAKNDVTGPLPLLYGQVRYDLPGENFYVSGNINWLSISDSSMIETKFKVGYQLALGLAFELGYRSLNLEHDDSGDLTIDTSIAGPFAGLQYKF